MEIATFQYRANDWSIPEFPAWDSPNTLVLLFGARAWFDENPQPIRALAAAYPSSVLAGCSTSGELFGATVADDTLVVAVVRFSRTRLVKATVAIAAGDDSGAVGRELASHLASADLKGVLVLSDGTLVNGSTLVAGINAGLPTDVVVTGGLAGDGSRFEKTWVLDGGLPQPGRVTAIGFCGEHVHIGHGSQGGWDTFGPERIVTRSEGNVLFGLDGKPALELYKHYLGERAAGLPATGLLFPLSLRATDGSGKVLVRTILAVDDVANSLTFAGDIPQGARVQLMRSNVDRLVGGATSAAKMAADRTVGDGPTLAIAVSCVGRRLVFGDRIEEEVEATLGMLPAGTKQIGFYSYGESSPFATGACDLHNQTMTLTTITES